MHGGKTPFGNTKCPLKYSGKIEENNMKKFVTAIILVCMMLSMAACGGSSEAEYKLGMGVVVSTDSSSDNNAQVDATVATVVTDANGKIVLCRLDCAQNKMDVTGGAVDTAKTFLTKRELGDDYNMVKYSDATLEWYQQAENFEAYCVGKTADEIAGIETKVNEEGYNVAVDETLYASCSISIEDFIGAVVKACSDEKGQTFKASGELKLGLAAITTAAESSIAPSNSIRSSEAPVTITNPFSFAIPISSFEKIGYPLYSVPFSLSANSLSVIILTSCFCFFCIFSICRNFLGLLVVFRCFLHLFFQIFFQS